jgi:hypothetical protein
MASGQAGMSWRTLTHGEQVPIAALTLKSNHFLVRALFPGLTQLNRGEGRHSLGRVSAIGRDRRINSVRLDSLLT